MTTDAPYSDTPATRLPAAKRATRLVAFHARPLVDRVAITQHLGRVSHRDPDTTPRAAVAIAYNAGDILSFSDGFERERLGLPTPDTIRAGLDSPDRETVGAWQAHHAEACDAPKPGIAAANQYLQGRPTDG